MPAQFFSAPNMAGYSVPSPRPVYGAPQVGGQLPFTTAAPPVPTNAAQLGASYRQEYGQAAQFNKSNYENVLSGYQATIAAQDAGYKALYSDVMGTLTGMEQGRATGIQDAATAEIGGATQSLINRGLGNTTVQQTVVSGVNANRDRRLTELTGEMAAVRGNMMGQLGQAHLGSLGALQQNQLQWMNSVSAPYPDAGLYAQLAQQYGATGAADDAARRMQQAAAPQAMPGGTGVSGRLGYTPAPATGQPAGAQTMPSGSGGGYSMYGGGPATVAAPDPGWTGWSAYGGNAVGMTGAGVTDWFNNMGNEGAGPVYGNAIGSTGGHDYTGGFGLATVARARDWS